MSHEIPLPASAPVRRVVQPRTWSLRPVDVGAIVVGNALLIGAMWVRHGGLAELGTPGGPLTALGQLTALYGTYLVLIQLVLMSRSPWLDQLFGMDRLAAAHRWVGFGCVWLLVAHGVLTTVGYSFGAGAGVIGEAWVLVTTYPFVAWAVVGLGLFLAVAISSVRAARARLSYELWHGIHLYAYLAIALTFAHQLVVGADFADDPVARLYWIGLYVLASATILIFRFGQPIRASLRHRLRVANVVREGPGVVSIYLTGRDLDQLGDPLGPVPRLPVPDPERLVARASVLDLGGTKRRLAAGHGQGSRRRLEPAPAARGRHPGVLRRTVWRADGRSADPLPGAARRRRDRDHPAPGAARGAAGPTGRDDPGVPGAPGRRPRLPGRARHRSPRSTARRSTTWLANADRGTCPSSRSGRHRSPSSSPTSSSAMSSCADPSP